jgi:lysophospholipase L1-like esterase
VFQPGFHQALRHEMKAGAATTFRFNVPVGRSGDRVRIAFRAGSGSLTLRRVTVARAGSAGALDSAPVPVTFEGRRDAAGAAWARILSDAIAFPVSKNDELAVTFEVLGSMAASSIANFPGSYARSGSYGDEPGPLGGTAHPRLVGLQTIEVEGPRERAIVAIGDSITEGYVSGPITGGTTVESGFLRATDDYRNAWTRVAEQTLEAPIANAAISGQGTWDAADHLDGDVFALPNLTDCVVLIGTNDLGGGSAEAIEGELSTLFQALQPHCQVWASTLLPKERTSAGSYEQVKARRVAINDWLRSGTSPVPIDHVIDLESVTRSPSSVHQFATGFGEDGIHPSVRGHQAMAAEVARVFEMAPPLQ